MNGIKESIASVRQSIVFIAISLFFILSVALLFAQEQDGSDKTKTIPKLTLADCIFLAMKNNFDVKKQYLGRISQRYSLKVSEDKFNPKGSFQLSTNKSSTYPDIDTGRSTSATQAGSFTASMNVITGGQFDFSWNKTANQADVNRRYYYNPLWSLQYTQPLLKNAGIEAATASVKIARIADEQNLLSFRDFLSSTINSVITSYRSYVSSLWNLEINKKSLETAKSNYEINKAKIAAGRMAALDIVETETNIASYELSVLSSQNNVDQARLTLIKLLNIDKDALFEPIKDKELHLASQLSPPSLKEALQLAFYNRPDYLTAIRNVETARLNYVLAKNNRLWDLSFQTKVNSTANNTNPWRSSETAMSVGKSDWSAGAVLTIPFRDLTIEQNYLSAKITLEQARIDLKKSEISIEIDLKNALRDVDMKLKQMHKAKQVRELAEKKYEVERDKYKAGRSTNFQLVSYQNDLVNAQESEVSSLIDYLNSLTNLDTALGTTLKTFNIVISKDTDEVKLVEKEK